MVLENTNKQLLVEVYIIGRNNIPRDSEMEKSYKIDAVLANFYM